MNIYQKLIEVRKLVHYLQKGEDGPQFKYVSSSQVLAAVRDKLDELALLLMPAVKGHKVTEHVNAKGTITYFTEIDIEYTWVNAENPEETVTRSWYAQGVDLAGEKGPGKAYTYSEKYFILKFFQIATDKDDPDSFQEQHKVQTLNANKASDTRKTDKKNMDEHLSGVATPAQLKAVHGSIEKKQLQPDEVSIVLQKFGVTRIEDLKKEDVGKVCVEINNFKVAK